MITKIAILMLMWPVVGYAIVYTNIIIKLLRMLNKYSDIPREIVKSSMDDAIYGSSLVRYAFKGCGSEEDRKKRLLISNLQGAFIWPTVLANTPEVLQQVETRFDENIARTLRTSEES